MLHRHYLAYTISLVLTFWYTTSFAQVKWNPVYTTHWDNLLSSPTDKSSILGVLATEASVMLLDSTDTYYKIVVSNGDIGYIKKQLLTTAMRGKTSSGEPAQYFYRGRQGQQGPHLYVQAAELRVRDMPSIDGKVLRRARLNEHTSLDYMPLYPEGWIYVGDHFHKYPAYIQAKYVGAEVTYEQVLRDYLQAKGKNAEQELTLVGRLRELAWDQPQKYLKQALAYYVETYVAANKDFPPAVDLSFENLIADRQQHFVDDYEQYEKQVKALDLRYLWSEKLLYDGRISDKQMLDLGFQRINDIPDFPECGWYPSYYYTSNSAIVAVEENGKGKLMGSVYSFTFSADLALLLGKAIINTDFSEADFVRQFGHLLSVDWISFPHAYMIRNGDAGFFKITFKNGKPVLFESIYYC